MKRASKTNKPRSNKPTLKKLIGLFLVFFRIGLFTFGGGYAMLPLIQKEIIEKKKWISEMELLDILVIAESTPGPVSVNTATFVGQHVAGFFGAFFATLALIIPSFVIIFVISLFFDDFIKIKWVSYAFRGIQAAVAVLVINAAIKLFKKMKKTAISIIMLAITAVLTLTTGLLSIDFSSIYFILLGFAFSALLVSQNMDTKLKRSKIDLDYLDDYVGDLK